MSAFGRTRAWLRAVVARTRMEREMHEEMTAHIAQAAERFAARGMSEHDALQAARCEFGHAGSLQQSARDARGGQVVDNSITDLKYALRYFVRTPLASITIILTLALGIGFSSAVFSVLTGILTRPAPGVPNDPALVKIRTVSDTRPSTRLMSYPELSAYAALTDKFASVVGWTESDVVFDIGGRDVGTVKARALFVTPNYFRTLGVGLAAGHGFSQSRFDDRFPAELTAIINDGLAAAQFGGAQLAIGRHIRINDIAITVIGVAKPRFNGAVRSGEPRTIWLPLSTWQLVNRVNGDVFANPNARRFEAFARLRPGVTLADATPAVRVVAARIDADAKALAARKATATADVAHLRGMVNVDENFNELGPGAVVFTAIALLVLLVCTTTVNSLLVGAASARRHEIGVRLALGASRSRIVRQLLTEISILAIAGGALGFWGFGALSRIIELADDGFDISPHWETAVFTLLYAVATAAISGLSPALHATRAGLSDVLKDGQGGATKKSRLQRAFVVAQIAIAQPLMVVLAAVMANMVTSLPPSSIAAIRERVMIAELDTHSGAAINAPDKIPGLLRRLAELPGVESALPVGYGQGWSTLELRIPASGSDKDRRYRFVASTFDVPPGYFKALDASVLRGREFVVSDTSAAILPVILSDSLATSIFKSGDPIGRRLFQVSVDAEHPSQEHVVEMEIVGVVGNQNETSTMQYPADIPPIFVPLRQRSDGRLMIRTTGPAVSLIPTVMSVARDEARLLPLRRIGTLAQADRRRRDSRVGAVGAVSGFGMITLLLASIGLYAMLRIAVEQRRREIGVRVALGARAGQVVRMFFLSGVRVSLVGLAIGLPVTIAGLAFLTRKTDMHLFLATSATVVTVAVVSVAALASWLPARRAASVDPMEALRSE